MGFTLFMGFALFTSLALFMGFMGVIVIRSLILCSIPLTDEKGRRSIGSCESLGIPCGYRTMLRGESGPTDGI